MTYEEYKNEMEEYGEMVLPNKIYNICCKIEALFDINFEYGDVCYYNRGGYLYAKAPGFSYTVVTSSLEDGPSVDYNDEIISMLEGLGFIIENSNGDNGMDGSTNWHDTFWTYEFAYDKLVKQIY